MAWVDGHNPSDSYDEVAAGLYQDAIDFVTRKFRSLVSEIPGFSPTGEPAGLDALRWEWLMMREEAKRHVHALSRYIGGEQNWRGDGKASQEPAMSAQQATDGTLTSDVNTAVRAGEPNRSVEIAAYGSAAAEASAGGSDRSVRHVRNRLDPDANPTASCPPRKKRGRPTEIPEERKRKALSVQGGKARAQILYDTNYPTAQQIKNVAAILRHFGNTHKKSE
jgi:hypothetical protein